jgi:hypothetical protein
MPKPVTVTLLDEQGRPATSWRLTDAVPTKIVAAGPATAGAHLAIEEIVLAFAAIRLSEL